MILVITMAWFRLILGALRMYLKVRISVPTFLLHSFRVLSLAVELMVQPGVKDAIGEMGVCGD
jgi:hypothetical protein